MTIRPNPTVRRSEMSRRQVVLTSLVGALSLITGPVFSQSTDDVGALTKQVDQLLQQRSYADANATACAPWRLPSANSAPTIRIWLRHSTSWRGRTDI